MSRAAGPRSGHGDDSPGAGHHGHRSGRARRHHRPGPVGSRRSRRGRAWPRRSSTCTPRRRGPRCWRSRSAGSAGGLYLWLRDPRLDVFAESSAEVGLVFSAMMLSTGPLWGKPIWGTWWQWEPRLTLTLLLVFLFIGYRALRNAVSDPSERARYSAIVGRARAGAGAVRAPERVPLPHHPPAADRAQAERAVACHPRCCGRCWCRSRSSRFCMWGS